MQSHHGTITVESIPGQGTTVRLLLPSISHSLPETILSSGDIGDETVQLSGDILVADDEPIVLMAMKLMLEQLGFTVHTAADGQEAVDMVHGSDTDFGVVVSDVLMGGMGGIEAMQKIRKIDPAIPILFITGYPEKNIIFQESQGDRPDGFLTKPVLVSEIRSELERLLSRHVE